MVIILDACYINTVFSIDKTAYIITHTDIFCSLHFLFYVHLFVIVVWSIKTKIQPENVDDQKYVCIGFELGILDKRFAKKMVLFSLVVSFILLNLGTWMTKPNAGASHSPLEGETIFKHTSKSEEEEG